MNTFPTASPLPPFPGSLEQQLAAAKVDTDEFDIDEALFGGLFEEGLSQLLTDNQTPQTPANQNSNTTPAPAPAPTTLAEPPSPPSIHNGGPTALRDVINTPGGSIEWVAAWAVEVVKGV